MEFSFGTVEPPCILSCRTCFTFTCRCGLLDITLDPRLSPRCCVLSERPPQQLSASELRSRIALLEGAARACHDELESRTSRLDALPDEIQQVIFGQLCNALTW